MDQIQTSADRLTPSQKIGSRLFRLWGWKIVGELPDIPKYIVIGAPHTTNWDWVVMIFLKVISGEELHWIGKDSLFRFPFREIMRKLGGIPVIRKERTNFVDQIIDKFNQQERLIVCITPEGTRGKTNSWKTGFYYIAYGARVPVVLASVDFPSKTLEIGPHFEPSGDINADAELLRKFYSGKQGKHPNKQGEIIFSSQ